MELRDIRYFAVVAENQNIGRAAEALELSATALSKSLRRLEKSVGAKLVKRAPNGIALTAVGAALFARIGPLRAMLNDVRHEATELAVGHAGHVHVGAGPGAPEHFLANACISLSRENSRITLKVSILQDDVLMELLLKGEIDFFVVGTRTASPHAVQACLYSDQYVIIASAAHRLARRKKITLADLAGERWASAASTLRPQWEQLFRALESKGLPLPSVTLETNSLAVRTAAIAQSNYLGISSRQFLGQQGRKFRLVELPVKEVAHHVRHMSIIYRKDGYLSPAARRLIEILKAQAIELAGGKFSLAQKPAAIGDRKKRAML